MTIIQTQETFPASHFVQTADPLSPCRSLHGHTWKVVVNIKGIVQKDGMVIDFRHIKSIIKQMDHKTLVPEHLIQLYDQDNPRHLWENYLIVTDYASYSIPKKDVYTLLIESVTAENLAKYFLKKIKKETMIYKRISVTVYESENSFAEEIESCQ